MNKNQKDFIARYVRENKSLSEWGKEYDCNLNTILRWTKEFKSEIEAERKELIENYKERVEKLGDNALITLSELLYSQKDTVRAKAVELILNRLVPVKQETKNDTTITEKVKVEITKADVLEYAEHIRQTQTD